MKGIRQRKIQELIEHKIVETQVELAEELKKVGIEATQATVSRDIKELGLIKVPVGNNRAKYSMPGRVPIGNVWERGKRMFQDTIVKMDFSENMIVIRTLPGSAQGVASYIDHMEWKEIIGSVAGDDTIFLIVKPKDAVPGVLRKFQEMIR